MTARVSQSQPLLARVDPRALAMVEDLFRNTAYKVRKRLINRVGGDMTVRYGASTVSSLGEVFDRLHGHGAAIGQFSAKRRDAQVRGVIVLEGALVHRMVGLMLGESDDAVQPGAIRALTSLDLQIAGRICGEILDGMCEASALKSPPTVALDSVTPTSRAIPSLPRSATVLQSTLDFGPADGPYGLASVLLPAQARGVLWSGDPRGDGRMAVGDGTGITRVLPVALTVLAELARVTLSFKKLRTIKVGDTLDIGAVREVELRVGGRPALTGEAGEADGVRSVRINRRVESR